MNQEAIFEKARVLGEKLVRKNRKVTCAESCTGGGIAFAMTAIAGSSAWFEAGFVTYSNEMKTKLLGVKKETLDTKGAVSSETVKEMTAGALEVSGADYAVAVSGIAGPGGAVPGKPVGTVCLAWQEKGKAPVAVVEHFAGDRAAVREATVDRALTGLIELIEQNF
ncbi:MAG TPA: damage-inducible protein CinA [Sutterella sp.]|nr:damage-inducible protein CinA [Sutterella sp.]